MDNENIDSRVANVMAILDKEAEQQEPQNTPSDPKIEGAAELPKEAIGEDQTKTSKPEENKLHENAAIEPPASWPSDDKEAFKSLPTWAQERIVARENERESFFTDRSKTIAAREREINDVLTRTGQAQEQYISELQRLNQIATQLMPAKFADIKTEADYLMLKTSDPARASEYEAFVQVLQRANQQSQQVQQQRQQEHLDREYNMLTEKFPEFKDPAKATTLLNEVRKAAVEYYGFAPGEVAVIQDHRYVPLVRDAMAWRSYQANLKAAAGKKVPSQLPTSTLRTNGVSSGSVDSERTNKILNLASQTQDLRKKAEYMASLL